MKSKIMKYETDFSDYLALINKLDVKIIKKNLEFIESKPFNHIVIDNFVDNNTLLQVEKDIRDMDDNLFLKAIVQGMSNVSINKLYLMDMKKCSENVRKMVNHLNSKEMI